MAVPATRTDYDPQIDILPVSDPRTANQAGIRDKIVLNAKSLYDQSHPSESQTVQDIEQQQLLSPERTPSPNPSLPLNVGSNNGEPYANSNANKVKSLTNGHEQSISLGHIPQNYEHPISNGILLQKPISKTLPAPELPDIPEEKPQHTRRKSSISRPPGDDKILKLSSSEIEELTSAPESLPLQVSSRLLAVPDPPTIANNDGSSEERISMRAHDVERTRGLSPRDGRPLYNNRGFSTPANARQDPSWPQKQPAKTPQAHDSANSRGVTAGTAADERRRSDQKPEHLDLKSNKPVQTRSHSKSNANPLPELLPSPMIQDLPLPPMSVPTYLQLELASSRPSPLYIHRSAASEYPYESSRIKFERLLNFLLLPPHLESVLLFGALACLDAWLHTFTILPLRFVKAVLILMRWWGLVLATEARYIAGFIYHGSGRFVDRQRGRGDSVESTSASRSASRASRPTVSTAASYQIQHVNEGEHNVNGHAEILRNELQSKTGRTWGRRHRRKKSQPSTLSSYHKGDILQGLLIIGSCFLMLMFDASRMYHSIRAQSAVKLYMIWNVLEVADRLLGAFGQDVMECLLADETLERGPDGRSKILRPLGMFILASVYTLGHAAVLFYQVISLNVAVNSYSNALLSLLLSNMFVEVKSAVFKKFEKDNIFQLTCADVVERFQLWLMLLIIGLRNIVEVGGLSITSNSSSSADAVRNATSSWKTGSILPASFTILPNWTGEVLSPFVLVLGIEMVVDWLKHAYISKFNNVKPIVYQKFLDILAKDYYTNAFINQNLTKRLGLPVIPLSCLFIRASLQTYHMFLATHLPPPLPSPSTDLSVDGAQPSPETTAALEAFDAIIRRALGRSTFGSVSGSSSGSSWWNIDTDDLIAFSTMVVVFGLIFLVLLACKLVLGILLLNYARNRYASMKEREKVSAETKGTRVGGWGVVEVDEDKRRWIYDGDPEGLKGIRERSAKTAPGKGGGDLSRVARYEMVAKRIW